MRSSRAAKTAAASKITESMRPKTLAQLALENQNKERSASVEMEPVNGSHFDKGRIQIIPPVSKEPTINEEKPDEEGYLSEDREEEIIVRNDIEGHGDAEGVPSDIPAADLDSTPLRSTPMVGILKNRLDSPMTSVANSGGGGINGARRSAHRVHFDPTSDRVTRFSKSPDKAGRPQPATPATALIPLSFMEEDGGSPPPKQMRQTQRMPPSISQKSPTASPQVSYPNEPFMPELVESKVQINQAMCQVSVQISVLFLTQHS